MKDSEQFKSLQAFLEVTQRGDLGWGRDVRERRPQYDSLSLVHAWKVHSPAAWAAYADSKMRIKYEMVSSATPENLRKKRLTTKLDAKAAVPCFDRLDSEVNEKRLLHGTKFEQLLPSILRNGLSEKLSGGFLGKAVYLAEMPEKMDQYPQAASMTNAESAHFFSHALYKRERTCLDHSEGLCYCFVVRTVLGVYMASSRLDAGCWMSASKEELRFMEGSKPEIPYHSLVAETGEALKRFREFAVYHRDRTYPEYLLAYRREQSDNPGDALGSFTGEHLRFYSLPTSPTFSASSHILPVTLRGAIRKLENSLQLPNPEEFEFFKLEKAGHEFRTELKCHFEAVGFAAEIVDMWEIRNPWLARRYFIHRAKVRAEMLSDEADVARRNGRKPQINPPPQKIGCLADLLPMGLDATMNECLLFHGTKKSKLCKLLQSGLSERFAGWVWCGRGSYLAEDIQKSSWYTDEDSGPEDALSYLHQTLFGDGSAKHPSIGKPRGHRYVLICRAALGFAKSFSWPDLLFPWRIFADAGKHELVAFDELPGRRGRIPYHSLVAEFDGRPREFVVFRSELINPIMLVAYRDEPRECQDWAYCDC